MMSSFSDFISTLPSSSRKLLLFAKKRPGLSYSCLFQCSKFSGIADCIEVFFKQFFSCFVDNLPSSASFL